METAGEDIAPLLLGSSAPLIAATLVGCSYYRDDPDEPFEIIECDTDTRQLLVRRDGQTRRVGLMGAYILHGEAQAEAFEQALTPEGRAAREDRREVAAFGFRNAIALADLGQLASALREARASGMPTRTVRDRILAIVEKYDKRLIDKLCRLWLSGTEGPVPGDIAIARASALRHYGRTDDAIACTDVLLLNDRAFSRIEERILLTQRAALWLDKFEYRNDPIFLDRAERCAARSWSIEASEACSLVYQKLKKLRSEHRREQSSAPQSLGVRARAAEEKWGKRGL